MTVGRLRALDSDTYRRLDRYTKLLGVFLVAAGLEVGSGTPLGFVLGVAGVIAALCTLFVPVDDEGIEDAGRLDADEDGHRT